MYILTNAIKNIVRNKKRNVLIGLVVLILITLSTISIIINTTTKEIIEDYQSRFGSDVSIDFDYEKLMSMGNESGEVFLDIKQLTAKQYFDFANSKYIKKATFQGNIAIDFLKDIKAVDEDKTNENMEFIIVDDNKSEKDESKIKPTGNVIFVSETELLEDFKTGKRKMQEGKFFEKDNETIISEKLAELNKLKVGDKISVQSNNHDKPAEVIISGIYLDATSQYGGMPFIDSSINRRNEIIMDINSSFIKDCIDNVLLTAKYQLKNPKDLNDFKDEIIAKGLPDNYKVTTDEVTYNKIVAPVLALESITSNLTVIVLVVGCIILLLIQALAIKERQYEIGVIRAMGLKKLKLIGMFICENLIITTICLCLGFTVGGILSQPISNSMIDTQVKITTENQKNEMDSNNMFVVPNGMEKVEIESLTSIDVKMSMETILKIIGVSLLIVMSISIISVVIITKHQPMQILSGRE